MLIEFSVENYKCFATQQTLNMRPDPDIHALDENLIRTGLTQENGKELELLPTVAIYGANASGKSSLVESVAIFGANSREFKDDRYDDSVPFSYKYTTTFFNNSDKSRISSEELSYDLIERRYFLDCIAFAVESLPRRDDSLSGWSVVEGNACYDDSESENKYGNRPYFFLNRILNQSLPNDKGIFESKHDEPIPLMATLDDPERKEKLKQLLRKADFNIEDITVHKAQSGKNKTLYTLEFKIKGQEETLWYNDQSEGTKRFLLMMPTIVHVLETGAILLADELEQHLHSDLCKEIVKLFNNPETNPHGSQLILTTHNQDLMSSKLMRPDQIYFINKDDKTGASTLCRASDFKKIDWSNRKYKVDTLYNDGVFDAKPHTYGLE